MLKICGLRQRRFAGVTCTGVNQEGTGFLYYLRNLPVNLGFEPKSL